MLPWARLPIGARDGPSSHFACPTNATAHPFSSLTWIAPDWALLRPIIEKSSTAYAAEHHIRLRTAADAEEVNNSVASK